MMNPFQKLGDLKKMRDEALEIQRQLAQEKVTVERNGVSVVMSGDQKVLEIKVDGQEDKRILEAVNEAIKKSQEVAARKLQGMSGGLGGLLGQ